MNFIFDEKSYKLGRVFLLDKILVEYKMEDFFPYIWIYPSERKPSYLLPDF